MSKKCDEVSRNICQNQPCKCLDCTSDLTNGCGDKLCYLYGCPEYKAEELKEDNE